MKTLLALACAAGVLSIAACSRTSENADAPTVRALPKSVLQGTMSVEEAIATRRSIRAYADRALSDEQLAQILWAAQGITHTERGLRTAPSAGALYPLEISIFTADGVYRYSPKDHTLTQVVSGDQRAALAAACLGQAWVRTNGAVILVAADYARTRSKYGDRAGQFVDIEVGCVCQNILLQATALGLAGVPVGAFRPDDVKRLAALPDAQTPALIIPVGSRAEN